MEVGVALDASVGALSASKACLQQAQQLQQAAAANASGGGGPPVGGDGGSADTSAGYFVGATGVVGGVGGAWATRLAC